jgi:multiple sugar transport system ATP-binding protein
MAGVSIRAVSKAFGPIQVLKSISLDVAEGEFLTLLGPSGCGKSTLLRLIAGLDTQDLGTIFIGSVQVDALRPKQRDVAMVFQSYALYPHMTVAQNMALPLRMRQLSRAQRLPLLGRLVPGTSAISKSIAAEVARTAATLGMDHLLERKPGQLSGGQRQRVAVGRAMVRRPTVFLMDEPLSNLDAKLRVQMRAEIKELHQRLGITFIYVTHDQSEAMTMSDRVAVMLDGELIQVATPQAIYADPTDRRVAEFIGSPTINMLRAVARDGQLVDVAGATLGLETPLSSGTPFILGVRPEAFYVAEGRLSGSLGGRVRLVEHMGSDIFLHLDRPGGDHALVARLPADDSTQFRAGQTVHLGFDADRALLFNANGVRIDRPPDKVAQFRMARP